MCQLPTASEAFGVRKFTWAEIEKSVPHNPTVATLAGQPAYVVIHNKVYDLGGDFVRWHPGGAVAISQLGKDASGAFDVFHKESTHEMLASFYVGDLADTEVKKPNGFATDVQELRVLIEKMGLYESNKFWYFTKIAQTLSLAVISVTMLALFGNNLAGVLSSALLMAVFFQQCGWAAHDFLHHQVFENRSYNDLVGYMIGNLSQGFSVAWWKHKHDTHHSVPNVYDADPDIDTMPLLAWTEHALEGFADFDDATLAKFMVNYQPIIFFPLLSFARLGWAVQSVLWNVKGRRRFDAFPTSLVTELALLTLHYTWYLGAAFTFLNPLYAVFWILASQCGCGLLLAAVFAVNHNGMPIYTKEEAKDMDYYQLAIETGRNVTPTPFNNWFTGGLNFQIEHHMFPTIPRHNLPRVAPLVQSLCKKHNVPYHTTSLPQGLYEVVSRLSKVAKKARHMRRN
ncbi:hypothetical protein HK104_010121 [Borealophlyctis nickersoniae]|nr:hypothetical protein HK104_010121 [Borealophlyctis nickersoniae]